MIRSAIKSLAKVHEEIRAEIHSEIPAQQLSILYAVALNPGITETELAKKFKMPQGTVSRNVKKLSSVLVEGERGRFVDIGYGLVTTEQFTTQEPKKLAVYLTARGKEVINHISDAYLQRAGDVSKPRFPKK